MTAFDCISTGSQEDPGLMVLSLERIFKDKENVFPEEYLDVTCSYLEVYNEVCPSGD